MKKEKIIIIIIIYFFLMVITRQSLFNTHSHNVEHLCTKIILFNR
jgi:hypothetical protein